MDQYDEHIERMVKLPFADVKESWVQAEGLFQFCGKDKRGMSCGCLTQIRQGFDDGPTPEFTKAIRSDKRLPRSFQAMEETWDGLTEKSRRKFLKPFAEWQRRLDAEIRQPV